MSQFVTVQNNFSSVSEFSDAISQLGWNARFGQLDCGRGDAHFDAIINAGAILHRVACKRRTKQRVLPPQGYRTFGLPVSPLHASSIENRPLRDNQLLYIHESRGFASIGDPGFEAYTVSIASSRLAELSANLGMHDPGDSAELWGTEIQPGELRLNAVKAMVRYVFEQAQQNNASPLAMRALDQLITLHLPAAILQLGDEVLLETRVPIRNRELALRRALAYIEAHAREALTVETLCTAAATSFSTLERAFRERFAISPKRYILVQRLNHVHTALLRKPADRRISDIASEWGFWHMGQFSTDYKRLFGCSPSSTAKAGHCGGSVKVIVEASNRCIEDRDVIDRILAHLREKEQEAPARPLLVPPTRVPPET